MINKAQTLIAIALASPLMLAQGQTTPTTAGTASSAPPLSPTEQTIQDIKNPTSWLSWGGDFRVRNEYFNNALSLTSDPNLSPFGGVHSQDYFRFRGRLWTSIAPTDDLSLNARLAAEPRDFLEQGFSDTYFERSGMQWRYGIIDNLNVQWKKPLDLPATLIVGRQDIMLGDGWLVGDGTPEDGSFTTFLDSVRLTYDLKDQQTTIDAIGIFQDGLPDAWLPTLGPSTTVTGTGHLEPFLLTDQNEKGAILWIANKSLPAANLDGYFIYKHDTALTGNPVSLFSDNANIYTFGGRVSGLVEEHLKDSAEGAYQFGRKQYQYALPTLDGDNQFHNLSAFGVKSKLSYLFKDDLNNQLSLSYEFLSGDDPGTKTDEMFDVLWGRWPQWSEMYNVYSYVSETRVAQTANLHRIGPSWSLTPAKNLDFSASYFALFADQKVPTEAIIGSAFSQSGNFRGHYVQAVLKYKFSRHVSGHLWGEVLFPGDYYARSQMMTFLRAELMLTF